MAANSLLLLKPCARHNLRSHLCAYAACKVQSIEYKGLTCSWNEEDKSSAIIQRGAPM